MLQRGVLQILFLFPYLFFLLPSAFHPLLINFTGALLSSADADHHASCFGRFENVDIFLPFSPL